MLCSITRARTLRSMLLKRRNNRGASIGARYRRRDPPYAVWEILAAYTGVDGRRHAVLFNVDDPTWHKTLSLAELENAHLYEHLKEGESQPTLGP